MKSGQAITLLRAHEAELRAVGVEKLSIFGSVARDAAGAQSDIDVVVRLSPEARRGGFAYIARLDALNIRLQDILGCRIDLMAEPIRRDSLRRNIEREALLAF
ncbi:MAG: nucleotidyltransferase domain-containing protein [Alphaproteobacteria bacterium]|nr:nucleotidyltransferase domain-containing protein [Alphaproteobacteria bacterium]